MIGKEEEGSREDSDRILSLLKGFLKYPNDVPLSFLAEGNTGGGREGGGGGGEAPGRIGMLV